MNETATMKEIKTFEHVKNEIIERCKAKDACQPEFKRVLASEDLGQLLIVRCFRLFIL